MKYKDKKGKKKYTGHLQAIPNARPSVPIKNYRNILMRIVREQMVDGKIVINMDQIEILAYVYDLEAFTQSWLTKNFDMAKPSQWRTTHDLFKKGFLDDYLGTTDYIANKFGHWYQKSIGNEPNYHTYSINQKGMAVVERFMELYNLGEAFKIDQAIGNRLRGTTDALNKKDEVFVKLNKTATRLADQKALERRINAFSNYDNEQRPEHVTKDSLSHNTHKSRKK